MNKIYLLLIVILLNSCQQYSKSSEIIHEENQDTTTQNHIKVDPSKNRQLLIGTWSSELELTDGIEKEFNGDKELSLLKYLRNVENITTVKDGCSGQATCGSCTVELSGDAVLSCVTSMKKVENLEMNQII